MIKKTYLEHLNILRNLSNRLDSQLQKLPLDSEPNLKAWAQGEAAGVACAYRCALEALTAAGFDVTLSDNGHCIDPAKAKGDPNA